MVVRPALMYGVEKVSLTKRQEVEQEVEQLKTFTLTDQEGQGLKMSIQEGQFRSLFGDKVRETMVR